MTLRELRTRVMRLPGVNTTDEADAVIIAVFQVLRDRLTPDEAEDVWAQLPTALKALWESEDWWTAMSARLTGMNKLHRDEFVARVQAHLAPQVDAEVAVRVVFHALKEQISVGEASDVAAQLPEDLRTLWRAA